MSKLGEAYEKMQNEQIEKIVGKRPLLSDDRNPKNFMDINEEFLKLKQMGLTETHLNSYMEMQEGKHVPNFNPKNDSVRRFEALNEECASIYEKKNKDYGNSFDKSLDEDGLLVAKIRLQDKMLRFSQLIKNPAEVKDESIRDTLIDMANYAKMTVMWMDENQDKPQEEKPKRYVDMTESDIKAMMEKEDTKHDDSIDVERYAIAVNNLNDWKPGRER